MKVRGMMLIEIPKRQDLCGSWMFLVEMAMLIF